MRVVSLNINGIRAACRKGFVDWLIQAQPDFVCLQEVRAQQREVPDLTSLGYEVYWHASERPGYSGVAVLSRCCSQDVVAGIAPEFDPEGRVLRVEFASLCLASVYVPSGSSGEVRQAVKMRFLERLLDWLVAERRRAEVLGKEFLVCGDFNIAHTRFDLTHFRSNEGRSGFKPEERAWIDELLRSGFCDVHRCLLGPEAREYTWWSQRTQAWANNVGWRLDYQFSTPQLAKWAVVAQVERALRCSDHAPLMIDYQFDPQS